MTPMPVADWQMIGSFADWSTTVVALLAFIVAALAAKATIETNRAQQQTLELQQRQFQESQRAAVQAQAEKVAAWHRIRAISVGDGNELVSDMSVIQNGSDLPIYDVWTAASGPRLRDGYIAIGQVEVVPPEKHEYEMMTVRRVDEATAKSARILLLFRDAAGRFWIRREDGKLEDADEDEWDYERHVLDQTRDGDPRTANQELPE